MTEKVKQANAQVKEVIEFCAQLARVLFTLSIIGLGAYAVLLGIDTLMLIKQLAFVVSGTCAVMSGTIQLYKTLMRK